MPTPDIVLNLLHLSSENAKVSDFLDSALDLVMRATPAEASAIVRAAAPDWKVEATRGIAAADVPLELAADALERGSTTRRDGWHAVPLVRAQGLTDSSDSHPVLLVRGRPAESLLDVIAQALADSIAVVARNEFESARIRRLETILNITHDWHQANDMNTLLVRIAEAATDLLDADRASIFLWDKPNRTIVGRPALGVADGELRLPDNAGIVGQVIQSGQPRRVGDQHDAQAIDRAVDRQTGYQTRTILCVPLVSPQGNRLGAFEVLNKRNGKFTPDDQNGLVELATYAAVALENTRQFSYLLAKHEKLVQQAALDTFLVGECQAIQAVRSTIRRVADTDLAILLLGENGTGKEVVARSIHFASRRRDEPFVAVNCAALTETLLESELFGHEKGAFTDARESQAGKFELAAGGTIFLDEIGDMSLAGQSKLLRVLEDKTVVRVGGSRPIHTDVRVIAATNQNLAELLRANRFRQDLYFRLNVVSIELPPLRDRGDDIMLLAEHFMQGFCRKAGRRPPRFTSSACKRLISHAWPGNVRELRNLTERLAYLSTSEQIDADELALILLPGARPSLVDAGLDLNEATRQFQQSYIKQAIERARGNVSLAAKNLGVHRSNLYRKMRQLGMETLDGEPDHDNNS